MGFVGFRSYFDSDYIGSVTRFTNTNQAIGFNNGNFEYEWIYVSKINRKKHRWLARRYGSRRGFIYTFWYRLLFYLGKYQHYVDVDWRSVDRLVFVCKGNICRSAYAEAVARSLGVNAISCGLDTIENAPANAAAVRTAEKLGINLKQHKTIPLKRTVLKETDLLIAMEPWQVNYLRKNINKKYHCSLLGLWGSPRLPHIQDPYGASPTYFENCFTYIQQSVNKLAEKMNAKKGN